MKFLLSLFTSLYLVGFCSLTLADAGSQLKAFPAAKEGTERFVILLPEKDRQAETQFKVELFAGKEMLTDGVNIMRLGNTIETKPLTGWGYTYYEVTGSGQTASTLMAPPENTPKVKKWVAAPSLLIDYNSRLPIVIYAPTGYIIKYRLWQAPEVLLSGGKG
jgi:ecotin